MDSLTLEELLRKDHKTKGNFRGVFSRNTLPRNRAVGFYIVNEEPSTKKGSHWIAFQITSGKKEKNIYFDSYGRKPMFKEFKSYLGKNLQYNKKCLQHMMSTSCGQWCIYFIWRRSEGWNLKNITDPFNVKKPLINDYIMNFLVKKRFKTKQDVINRKFLAAQISRQMKDVLQTWLRQRNSTDTKVEYGST